MLKNVKTSRDKTMGGWINGKTDRQTDRQMEKQKERQTNRLPDRQAGRQARNRQIGRLRHTEKQTCIPIDKA